MAGWTFLHPMPRRCRLRSCPDWFKTFPSPALTHEHDNTRGHLKKESKTFQKTLKLLRIFNIILRGLHTQALRLNILRLKRGETPRSLKCAKILAYSILNLRLRLTSFKFSIDLNAYFIRGTFLNRIRKSVFQTGH